MKQITVLIGDDQRLFREALRTLLDLYPNIKVVGEAANGEEILSLVEKLNPQVVLMDLKMPVLDGVASTYRLKAKYPNMQVIILTTFDDDDYIFEALRAGALGYLLKDSEAEKLVEAIELASKGESFLQPVIAAKVVAEFARLSSKKRSESLVEVLSGRENEILRHIGEGASNKEIATQLFIAEGTVKNHISNILSKLGVRDRTQALIRAKELKLI
jgi:DNA-binding NarL/FixJ family response regulator